MAPPDRVFRSPSQAVSQQPIGLLDLFGGPEAAAARQTPTNRGILGFMVPPDAGQGYRHASFVPNAQTSHPSDASSSLDKMTRAELENLTPYERWLVTLPDDSPELTSFSDPRVGPAPIDPPRHLLLGANGASDTLIGSAGDDRVGLPPIPPRKPDLALRQDYPLEFIEDRALLAPIEGGYSNRRTDPGGPTNLGITQKTYSRYYPGKDVKNITPAEANHILYDGYWAGATMAEALPAPIRSLWFDVAVNSGPGAATRQLQRALGMTGHSVDGILGPNTRVAVDAFPDKNALGARMLAQRAIFYDSLRTSTDVEDRENYADSVLGWADRLKTLANARLTPIDHVPPGRRIIPAFNPPSYPGYAADPMFYPENYPGY